jgi:hypothetical protein
LEAVLETICRHTACNPTDITNFSPMTLALLGSAGRRFVPSRRIHCFP